MKKFVKLAFGVIAATSLTTTMALQSPVSVNAKSVTTTPKSLRGTWYEPIKHHGYAVTKITAHSVSNYSLNSHGKISSKRTISSKKAGIHKLHVVKHRKGYGGPVYSVNKATYSYQQWPLLWVSHRTIHGKRYRVLKEYNNGGSFAVLTKQKLTHDGSYQYNGDNYMHEIGK